MSRDPLAERLFDMKLLTIYNKHEWLKEELTFDRFKALFPIVYKENRPVNLDKPAFDLDRSVFLEVLIAFKQSFK